MTEFGDFANIDIDKLLRGTDEQFAKAEQLQQEMAKVVGRAEDPDGLVTVEYAQEGLRTLDLHPKAMRLGAAELAEKIKATIEAATADLQRGVNELMSEIYGEEHNPMRFLNDPEGALSQVRQAEATYERTFEDVMGELDRIRRRLDL
ncbi:YbaB/EbfC family nucleoid-associated protein [Nonomuraea pusilla]|uniref:YbaB/EbfC DNA-binding family protein n=1 Tax=Nonomuraea pusilla TaxID=46177 RepID=A0A1H7V9F4_9ACTN|nr:YbaB/EbfC family nucleoid-associated protein [Nonomuraea pusilla]SEM05505.1 YbaB/EbfC DNA-binding family protein [Nonomuraea pusilla]